VIYETEICDVAYIPAICAHVSPHRCTNSKRACQKAPGSQACRHCIQRSQPCIYSARRNGKHASAATVEKTGRSSVPGSPKKRSRTVTTQRQPSKRAAASAVKRESYSSDDDDDASSSDASSPPRSRANRGGGSSSSNRYVSSSSSSRARCAAAVEASDASSFWSPAAERRSKTELKGTQQQQQQQYEEEQRCTTLSLKRASFSPSAATGLVGLAENAFIASFLRDFKPFMPIVSERPVQSALAKFLQPFDR
jgi:hypothetical protein